MQNIIKYLSSDSYLELMFFGTWLSISIWRYLFQGYLHDDFLRTLYVILMSIFAISAVIAFFAYFKKQKFKSWLSIVWFYACIGMIVKCFQS